MRNLYTRPQARGIAQTYPIRYHPCDHATRPRIWGMPILRLVPFILFPGPIKCDDLHTPDTLERLQESTGGWYRASWSLAS